MCNTVSIGFCDQPTSEGFRSLNTEGRQSKSLGIANRRSLNQESGYSNKAEIITSRTTGNLGMGTQVKTGVQIITPKESSKGKCNLKTQKPQQIRIIQCLNYSKRGNINSKCFTNVSQDEL